MPDSPSTELRKLIAERNKIYASPAGPSGGPSQNQLSRLREIESRTRDIQRGVMSTTGKRVAELVKKTTGSGWGASPTGGPQRRTTPVKVADAGAADKRRQELIREEMALGPMISAEGKGGFFEAIRDPTTGELTSIAPGVGADIRLGKVTPGVTGGRSGAGTPKRDLGLLDGLTVADVKKFYLALTDEELVKVQNQLVEAGLTSDKVRLGIRDGATADAMMNLLEIWQANPKPIKDLLGELKRARAAELDADVRKLAGVGKDGKAGATARTAVIKLTDESTLGSMIDTIAVDLFGEKIDDQRKAQLVAKLQDQERASKTGDAQADYDIMSAEEAAAAGPEASELDRFMGALIGQESGGAEDAVNADSGAMGLGQIMPENWGPWAAEAGADPADFSAGNQRRVIRYKLAQYYANYGNWRDVALAWYGGGGSVQAIKSGRISGNATEAGGYPSLNAYADKLLASMEGQVAQGLTAGTQGGLTIQERQSLADPQTRIENELKAMDPAKYFGTQFYKQASNFFSLLRGPE
jgi:hypothetical protein